MTTDRIEAEIDRLVAVVTRLVNHAGTANWSAFNAEIEQIGHDDASLVITILARNLASELRR